MDPWYRVVTHRKEVREGRSFSPDEFVIPLDQVLAGTETGLRTALSPWYLAAA